MSREDYADARSIKTFIVHASLIRETDKALLLYCEGDSVWFPKSHVQFNAERSELRCPAWILEQVFPKEDWS